jgi:asparagine synthase (glutamine-hydrolysing)
MQQKDILDAIREAKKALVDEKVLKQEVLDKKITPRSAYEADNYDWRYFSAAGLFR